MKKLKLNAFVIYLGFVLFKVFFRYVGNFPYFFVVLLRPGLCTIVFLFSSKMFPFICSKLGLARAFKLISYSKGNIYVSLQPFIENLSVLVEICYISSPTIPWRWQKSVWNTLTNQRSRIREEKSFRSFAKEQKRVWALQIWNNLREHH